VAQFGDVHVLGGGAWPHGFQCEAGPVPLAVEWPAGQPQGGVPQACGSQFLDQQADGSGVVAVDRGAALVDEQGELLVLGLDARTDRLEVGHDSGDGDVVDVVPVVVGAAGVPPFGNSLMIGSVVGCVVGLA